MARTLPARDGAGAHGQRLVEQRQAVAHGALGGARDQRQRVVLGVGALLGGDALEVLDQHRHVDAPQVEALAARQHGHRHLAHLGGGEDELHVLGRLLQRLQQRVEGALGEHVHLVDQVHLVAGHQRLVARALDDLAHVVDAGVGGGVHLQHVGVPALHDLGAVAPEPGHVEGRLVDAVALVVERARQDARGGGLADAAHAGQHVALGDAVGGERVPAASSPWPPGRSGRRRWPGRYLRASTT